MGISGWVFVTTLSRNSFLEALLVRRYESTTSQAMSDRAVRQLVSGSVALFVSPDARSGARRGPGAGQLPATLPGLGSWRGDHQSEGLDTDGSSQARPAPLPRCP